MKLVILLERLQKEKKLEDEKDYLLYAIAHDLGTPISIIQSSAELLALGSDSNRSITRIITNTQKLDRLIVDLLDSARLKSGSRLQLNLEPNNLCEVVKNAVEDLQAVHGDIFCIDLKEHDYDDFQGLWDRQSIRRLVFNLADNAIKYGDTSNKVKIYLQLEGDYIKLSLNNKGAPIEAHRLEKLKEMFEGKTVIKKNLGTQKGWGIGLLIVRGIVNAYNGSIDIASDENDGTTFCIDLPNKKN